MSREIKYRVKVTWCDEVRIAQVSEMQFGKWIEGAVIGKAFFDLCSYSVEEVDFETSPATGDVLMQYTGSKDKNGVEIYEGDIVNVNNINGVFKVIFDEWFGGFCLVNPDYADRSKNPKKSFNLMRASEFFEVIGNIYENADLLEASNEQG
ncbi:YopX family protein [Ignatzschineria rhizosphaerae]|uniref:YopX family protein n=1 Tax=Ignatzschineria rhizosphaerae TaxID=2923279 RepID=A0ABY3X562_9GAMM|nr:YopX family protein [Ignatzschineria rhizosphaerae]UNM95925.1 YopX family protein [Ignatzschineria rhizosphaerae]